MTTKRLKKLLMAMGLSRNQVNRMVKEQRGVGSKKVSNALYYHVFKRNFKLFTSPAAAKCCRISTVLFCSDGKVPQ